MIFLVLAVAVCQYTCPKFRCGSVKQDAPSLGDVCVKKNTSATDTVYQLQLCPSPSTQNCNFTLGVALGNCTPVVTADGSRYPGDPCVYGRECISGSCPTQACSGTQLGGACASNIECDAGLFCNSAGKCDVLVKVGNQCSKAKGTCENHLTCTFGVCVQIGSLPQGNETDNSMACSTMFAMVDAVGKLRCHEGPKLKGGSIKPTECQLGTLCSYGFDHSADNLTKGCKCGVNPSGKAYCHPGEGIMTSDISKVSLLLISSS